MDHLLELFHSEHDGDILDVDLQMLQAWLVFAPSLKLYIVSTVLFHKYVGANIAVANFMSNFFMSFPTKATVKLSNRNTGRVQVIGIVLCCFPNCPSIYPVVPVYYFPGHLYNTISLGALKFYVGFQKVAYEPLENCDFFDPQDYSWR